MYQNNVDYPYIVADIGGTNARFGLVNQSDDLSNEQVVTEQQTYPSKDFACVEEAVTCYRESIAQEKVSGACLAVAGPVAGKNIKLTNLNWDICIDSVKQSLKLEQLHFINDFAAYAYSIQYLKSQHLRTINAGVGIDSSPIAVVGPGTGFGVASLVKQNGTVGIIASEGGHMSLAANTALQAAIKEQLSRKFSLVSIERVFSGPGLRHLYHALAAVEGTSSEQLHTAEITQFALDGSDDLCLRTLSLFCSWLGSVTGDLALTLGAQGGVYLGGGILPRITDFLIDSEFQRSFKAKDQMSHYLQDIPVQLVTKGNTALLGAAEWYKNMRH